MSDLPLTWRQYSVLAYVAYEITLHDKAPTIKSIAECSEVSWGSACQVIHTLIRKGMIQRSHYGRDMRLTEKGVNTLAARERNESDLEAMRQEGV